MFRFALNPNSGTLGEGMAATESSSRRKNPYAEASNRKTLSPSTLLSPASSLSLKSVTMNNWWLVQAEGNGIAVEGFAARPLGTREFCSAPIVERHDSITLETADGITVILGGMINRLRTLQNGFPVSVCNLFVLGFPPHWEEVTAQFYSSDRECSATNPGITLTPAMVDDLSVIQLRDVVMSIPEGCEHQFWDLLLQQPKDDGDGRSNKGGSHGEEGEKETGKSEMEGEVLVTPSNRRVVRRVGGVVTRSMQRKKKEKENVVEGSERLKCPSKLGSERKQKVAAAVRSGKSS
ncbi:unnamed protein product [Linum tenue]|uniref:SANTA domain-containing protein n=1 Tax=Linum tenue TaxID=586396 RepID=A0AAV0KAM6_9ROSI|nr:unnamed protein product [Linum tenue]